MIAEEHDDQPRIAVITCGGMRTGADATGKGKGDQAMDKERS
jgi:hypothetical protein